VQPSLGLFTTIEYVKILIKSGEGIISLKCIKEFLSQHKHFYSLILLTPLLVWFKYLEHNLVPRYMVHASLDNKIPFIKEFVVPYVLWFGYVAYGVIYTGLHSKRDYYKLYIFLAGGMSLCYTLYMLFPNAQNLRPVITGNDIFSNMVKIIYLTDTPTNVCPSIHVFNSIAVDAALRNSASFSAKRYGKAVSSILAISICLSTVFIKQHSIIDVFTAAILGAVFYVLIYKIHGIKKLFQHSQEYPYNDILEEAANN